MADSTRVPPRPGKKGSRPPARGTSTRPSSSGAKGRQARQAAARRNRTLAILSVVVVVAVVAVVVVVIASSGGSDKPRSPAPPSAVQTITSVPIATLTGASGQFSGLSPAYNPPTGFKGGALTSGGKPELMFIGAEFCPICAAERWPMTIALSKFGTFTNLQKTHSAVKDGNIGTWSYYGATYSSPYLTFVPYEAYTNQPSGSYYKPLDTVPPDAANLWYTLTPGGQTKAGFPFIDFGNKFTLQSAQYSPELLVGHSFDTTLQSVGNNSNTIGADIDASAAVFTRYLCVLTNNQPGNVCSAVASVPHQVVNAPTSVSNTPAGGSSP